MKNKQPYSFCETQKDKCTMNYCDDNGCNNRTRIPASKPINNQFAEIRLLWLKGETMSNISKKLKAGFNIVKQAIIDMGIEESERDTPHGRRFKNIDRHTGMVKVQLDNKTWAYMEPGTGEKEFRDFKIKQLRL